jgi:integrase/recombinase XerC
VLTALDTGLRVNELLTLRRSDVDLDNLLLKVVGKGNKHRLVPISIELRKCLYRYLSKHDLDRVFAAHHGANLETGIYCAISKLYA